MSCKASIELRDLKLQTQIGTYKTGDIIPNCHLLDLTLWINSSLVFIAEDSMSQVFNYDPLVADIIKLAGDDHYETQERLISRIIEACSTFRQIDELEISLRKSPVNNNSGSLGVKLYFDQTALSKLRNKEQN